MYDVAIVGGGIVGTATGYKLLRAYPRLRVLLLEKEAELASHQTGHNSGVIHSGIYYRPGSSRATMCRRGVEQLVAFCREREIRFELCGKVILATTEDERRRLHLLLERGRENGVPGLRLLSREELREIEPHAFGLEALHSPETGIVSFRDVARECASAMRSAGADLRLGAELVSLTLGDSGARLATSAGDFEAALVINCAGLHSDRVAAFTQAELGLTIVPFRGEYYRLKPDRRHLVQHLIYPVPDPRFPFLGVHFTRMVEGGVEAGPNAVLAFAREGYRRRDVDFGELARMLRFPGFWRMARAHWRTALAELYRSAVKSAFVRGLRRLVPEIEAKDLEEGGSGVRAMALSVEGELVDDFRILRSGRAIHVLNAPSPAATSALAIADAIVDLAREVTGGAALK